MISDDELIRGCINQNRTAQKELYTKYAGKMKTICLRYTQDEDEAKDLLQEGFIKLFANIKKYSGKGSFEGWLKRLMINTALDHLKKEKRIKHLELNSANEISEETEYYSDNNYSEQEYTHEELLAALNKLQEHYKVVFNLYYIDEYSHQEISNALGIDEKTSRSRLFRAKNLIRNHLIEAKLVSNSIILNKK